jgi:hypothetical protein
MDLVTATLPFSFHVLHSILLCTFDYFVGHTHQTESHFCLYSLNVRLSALLFALWEGPVEIAYSQYQLAAAEPQHEQQM